MIFLNSASSAAALFSYIPGLCTHTDNKGKQRKARLQNILKSLKKTQDLMNTLYVLIRKQIQSSLLELNLLRKILHKLSVVDEAKIADLG